MAFLDIFATLIEAWVTLVRLSWRSTTAYLVDHLFMPSVIIVLRFYLIIYSILNILLSTVH